MTHSPLFDQIILKSWWVILFFLICFFAYDQALLKRNQEESRLRLKLVELKTQKQIALNQQEDLQLQIASQDDLAWIELVLMRRLGLVPEGQRKVLFIPLEG